MPKQSELERMAEEDAHKKNWKRWGPYAIGWPATTTHKASSSAENPIRKGETARKIIKRNVAWR